MFKKTWESYIHSEFVEHAALSTNIMENTDEWYFVLVVNGNEKEPKMSIAPRVGTISAGDCYSHR